MCVISSPDNLAVAILVERGQVNILGNKDYVFKRFCGAPEHVYYIGVYDEAAGACPLVQLPYGSSGDSKEGDRCWEEQGQSSGALLRPQSVHLEVKRSESPHLALALVTFGDNERLG